MSFCPPGICNISPVPSALESLAIAVSRSQASGVWLSGIGSLSIQLLCQEVGFNPVPLIAHGSFVPRAISFGSVYTGDVAQDRSLRRYSTDQSRLRRRFRPGIEVLAANPQPSPAN